MSFTDTKLWDITAKITSVAALGWLDSRAFISVCATAAGIDAANIDPVHVATLLAHIFLFGFLLLQSSLILLRPRPVTKAKGLQPRISAMLGTWLMVGVVAFPVVEDLPPSLYVLAAALSFIGDAFAIYVMLHLGRSFSFMAEARRTVFAGPYSVVRHPLYLAEETALLSGVILRFSVGTLCLLLVQVFFQFQRMRNEETLLAETFPEYRAYMERTPRLVPNLNWFSRVRS